MIQTPVFKPHLSPVVVPDEGVLLLSEDCGRALHGRLYECIAPLLDGRRRADDLVTALAGEFTAAQVYYALMLLEKNGHIAEATPEFIPADQAAFWSGQGLEASSARAALAERPVALHAIGAADPQPLQEALARLGVRIGDGDPALTVLVTDSYQRPALAERNAAFHAADHAWLVMKPNGFEPWVGPLYRSGATGCHACLVKRLARHRQAERFAADTQGQDEPLITTKAALPATLRLGAELAALEVAKHLAGASSCLGGAVISLDSRTLATQTHPLLPDPACPVCGTPSQPAMRALHLVPRKVHFMQDGGHRHVTPEQTLRRYEHLVSPITGIVSQLKPVNDAMGLAHVFVAGHNHAFKLDRLDHLKRNLRNVSAGKGVSVAQARASALCEALERYSGERHGDELTVTGSLRQMTATHGADAIHPNSVMRYSDRQFAEREAWNARKSRFNSIPEPLDEDLPMEWAPVWSLSRERTRYLPTQLVYFQSPPSAGRNRIVAIGCSNGNASGNTLEEAILQGFFELVERDAVALWWYNRLPKPGVDLAGFNEPWILDLAAHYDDLGRDSWALDLTSDLGIPTFVAVSRLRGTAQDRLLFGLGCHLDARIALQRSFAELNQMFGLGEQDEAAGMAAIEDEETHRWLTTATLDNQPYLAPDPEAAARHLGDFPRRHGGELLNDIALCREIIESRGMEMLVLDQTRADIGMPVVKVVVPGLRHFWARLAPGRLYDVPVAMGWLSRPLTEDEMNPIPIFF